MSTFLTVFTQQLRDGRRALWAALLLGIIGWMLTFLPHAQGSDPVEVREMVALTVSSILLLGLAVVLGSSLFSRDLLEGRLAFFYTRPIGILSLWGGRLAAACVLLALIVFIVWLPALLTGGSPDRAIQTMLDLPEQIRALQVPMSWVWGEQLWFFAGEAHDAPEPFRPWRVEQWRQVGSPWLWSAAVTTLLLLLSHIVTISLRVRSAWIALDVGAALAASVLIGSAAARLAAAGAWGALLDLAVVLVAGGLLITSAVLLTQLVVGRTLPKRFHAAGSIVLGASLFLGAGLISLRTHALLSTGVEALTADRRVIEAPQGSAQILAGPVDDHSGFAPVFVVDDQYGTDRLGTVPSMPMAPVFSGHGRALAWRDCPASPPRPLRRAGGDCRTHWLDLDATPSPVAVAVPAEARATRRRPIHLALDHAGRRLASYDGRTVIVVAMPENKLLYTGPFDEFISQFSFEETASGEVLRLSSWLESKYFELDVAQGRIEAVDLASPPLPELN